MTRSRRVIGRHAVTRSAARRSRREVATPGNVEAFLAYLRSGSGKAAAAELGTSEVDVRRRMSNLYGEWGVVNSGQAALVAAELLDIALCRECGVIYEGGRAAHRSTREHSFWRGVARGPGCWEWTRTRLPNGYGRVNLGPGRGMGYAHRLSYELHFGPIPAGMYVMHRCDNRPCVRPEHLTVGTPQENVQDYLNKSGRARRRAAQTSG